MPRPALEPIHELAAPTGWRACGARKNRLERFL